VNALKRFRSKAQHLVAARPGQVLAGPPRGLLAVAAAIAIWTALAAVAIVEFIIGVLIGLGAIATPPGWLIAAIAGLLALPLIIAWMRDTYILLIEISAATHCSDLDEILPRFVSWFQNSVTLAVLAYLIARYPREPGGEAPPEPPAPESSPIPPRPGTEPGFMDTGTGVPAVTPPPPGFMETGTGVPAVIPQPGGFCPTPLRFPGSRGEPLRCPIGGNATSSGVPRFVRMNPNDLRWSQRTAGGRGRASRLREWMRNGWNGRAVDAVETSEGIVTIDNTRPAIALEFRFTEIPVRVWLPCDPLPESMLGRFGDARTWGEALQFRTSNQVPPLPPTGTPNPPRLPN